MSSQKKLFKKNQIKKKKKSQLLPTQPFQHAVRDKGYSLKVLQWQTQENSLWDEVLLKTVI